MTLLAHHFLVCLRRQFGGRSLALTVPQVRLLLQVSLPRRSLDAASALALIRYTERPPTARTSVVAATGWTARESHVVMLGPNLHPPLHPAEDVCFFGSVQTLVG
jgi:hypothetical protein